MVDEKQLAFNTAVELSYLMPDEQVRLAEEMEREQTVPSLSQAQKMNYLRQQMEEIHTAVDTLYKHVKGR